jgi:hypothetical protein
MKVYIHKKLLSRKNNAPKFPTALDKTGGNITPSMSYYATQELETEAGQTTAPVPLMSFDSDETTVGIAIGDIYELSENNEYGLPQGMHKTKKV